jgi:TatD DNase family protein
MLSDSGKIQLIDIHTHQPPKDASVTALQSFFIDDAPEDSNLFFSAGIHPWHVKSDNKQELENARHIFSQNRLSAVGEIGLDRRKNNLLFEQQKEVFQQQLNMAEEFNLPVVIHCVKAYSDLLSVLKESSPSVPLIIHAYNENIETARQLLKHDTYFSFGEFLYDSSSKAVKVFPEIDTNKIFLETDESAYRISDIYRKAAELKSLNESELQRIIKQNFFSVF